MNGPILEYNPHPVSLDRARALAQELGDAAPAAASRHVPLLEAGGSYLAEDLAAPYPLPHYESSAMDGWALAEPLDTAAAWTLSPDGTPDSLRPGEATPVVTGGTLPQGTAVVLPLEHGQVSATETLSVAEDAPAHALRSGRHIRRTGTEANTSDVLVPRGKKLTPVDLALAAAIGADTVQVSAPIAATLIRTGNEVVSAGVPTAGTVRDSFSALLPPMLSAWGAQVETNVALGDSLESTLAALDAPTSLIVTTGGTGPSGADHLLDALRMRADRIAFASIAMRPGHPTMMAQMKDGRTVLSLPGNPLAAVCAAMTLLPQFLAGVRRSEPAPERTFVSAKDVEPLPGRTRVTPAILTESGVRRANWVGSGMLRGLASADVLMLIPESGLAAGDEVATIALPWL